MSQAEFIILHTVKELCLKANLLKKFPCDLHLILSQLPSFRWSNRHLVILWTGALKASIEKHYSTFILAHINDALRYKSTYVDRWFASWFSCATYGNFY